MNNSSFSPRDIRNELSQTGSTSLVRHRLRAWLRGAGHDDGSRRLFGQRDAVSRCGDFKVKRSAPTIAALFLTAAFASSCQQVAVAASPEHVTNAPAASRAAKEGAGLKTAIFAGGCYWGVEGVFSHVSGVTSAVSGFAGGAKTTAEYDTVSGGNTGHAESVKVTYDPAKIRYDQLLQVFFSVVADPTELNRQGPDTGTQYRSALVPLNAEQQAVASAYLAQLKSAHLWKAPIVTRIEGFKGFYPASRDHQDFMADNPNHSYIQYWDAPKVAALKKMFPAIYKPSFTRG